MSIRKLIAAVALLSFASSSVASVVISNYPPNNHDQMSGIGPTQAKAAGWTLPALGSSYRLDSLTARLGGYDPADAPLVRIFDDNGGTPGSSLLTLNNPTPNDGTVADFTFTASGDLVMAPGLTYWVVFFIDAAISATTFNWMANVPNITPTGLFSNAGFLFASNPTGSWQAEPSLIFNTYQLNASAVPVPALGAPALLLGTVLMAALRRRRRT
jgi:hypothetical protein